MTLAIVIAWWLIGIVVLIAVDDGRTLTWGRLLWFIVFGCFGPILGLFIGFTIIVQADFWSRPVFPKSWRDRWFNRQASE